MRQLWLIASLCCYIHLTTGLVTLETIRNLTALTEDLRGRITAADEAGGSAGLNDAQIWIGGSRRDEVEDTLTAALKVLCSDLLVELEKPIDGTSTSQYSLPVSFSTSNRCTITIHEFHHFLEAAVKLLYQIQERQMLWRWTSDSGVFDGIAWLQALWASRKANSQSRSYIEQQMTLYASTGCFGKSQEVLRRNVEVVEYLNDLMDTF